MYPGPIGAILTPQLLGLQDSNANTLPGASSLCGACYEVCPVRINIPQVLVYLRSEANAQKGLTAEVLAMNVMRHVMSEGWRFEGALKLARVGQGPLVQGGQFPMLPGVLGGWTQSRDLPAFPDQSFREWWQEREKGRRPAVDAKPQETPPHDSEGEADEQR